MNFTGIHNFYETLVLEAISDSALTNDELNDTDFLEDVACVALNNLPAKYVRHDVDLMFYMTTSEYQHITSSTVHAVKKAIDYVRRHRSHHKPEKRQKTRQRKAS